MKKVLISMVLCLSLLALAACGDSGDTKETSAADSAATTQSDSTAADSDTPENANNPFANVTVSTPDLSVDTYDEAPSAVINLEGVTMNLGWNFTSYDAEQFNAMSDADKQKIAETKRNLDEKLVAAFNAAGISVQINAETGEAMLDSSVLFGGDSAELTEEGKAVLQKFISAYSSVLLDDEFNGFISKVLVEGHAAPVTGDTYEDALPLSEERAKNVMEYCLSSDAGISADAIAAMKTLMESKGYSNSRPVKDSSGNVDMAASRRVSFRFLINIDA